jgi:hypothetical protein
MASFDRPTDAPALVGRSFAQPYADVGKRPMWRHLLIRTNASGEFFARQCPLAGCEVVSAATTDSADTLMPLIASAFASYSAAHPRYRFGHDD